MDTSPLGGLPAELRNNIFELAMYCPEVRLRMFDPGLSHRLRYYHENAREYGNGLSHACRRIHQETRGLFGWSDVTVTVSSSWSPDEPDPEEELIALMHTLKIFRLRVSADLDLPVKEFCFDLGDLDANGYMQAYMDATWRAANAVRRVVHSSTVFTVKMTVRMVKSACGGRNFKQWGGVATKMVLPVGRGHPEALVKAAFAATRASLPDEDEDVLSAWRNSAQTRHFKWENDVPQSQLCDWAEENALRAVKGLKEPLQLARHDAGRFEDEHAEESELDDAEESGKDAEQSIDLDMIRFIDRRKRRCPEST